MSTDLNEHIKDLSKEARLSPASGTWDRIQLKLQLKKEKRKLGYRKVFLGISSLAAIGLLLFLLNISNDMNQQFESTRVKYDSYQLVDLNEDLTGEYYDKSVHLLNKAYRSTQIEDFKQNTLKATLN